MDQRNTKLFTFMILCFATLILESVSSADDNHTKFASCTPKWCGRVLGSYPFWISSLQESYCGYPGFEVTCVDDDVPILTISGDSYVIKQIYHENEKGSIHVVRNDSEVETCPIPLRNSSFDGTPFVPNPNSILSFFFNCKDPPRHDTIPVDCASNTSIFTDSSVAIDHRHRKLDGEYDFTGSCNFSVSVPVIFDVAVDEINGAAELVKNGFMLNWTAPTGCCDCEASGGHCGSRDSSFVCYCKNGTEGSGGLCGPRDSSFDCYCKDGTEGHPKCSSEKINWGRKIGIAVGAAGVGVGLTCLAVFIYHRRRKRRQRFAPSSFLSRGLSSDPSSSADFEKGSNIGGGVHIFTYTELEEATGNFDSSKELGDGGYGTVYYGKLQDGRSVAVKRLYENNCRRVEQFMNEVKILTGLRHKNLVSLYGCTSRHSRELLLVYEYVSNGTLADHLHGERANTGSLTWPLRMSIAVETASALMYLHASTIIHRDVKTNNILLDNNFCVKVADFGLSRLFPADVTHVSTLPQGTPGYVDPEYHQCYQLTDRSDVYSFGVVLVELISSMPAVDITRHRHEINLSNLAVTKIQNHTLHELVDPSLGFHRDAKVKSMIEAVAELAFQCLQSEKEMRPSMEEVVESLKHASCLVKPGDGDIPEANPHLRSPDTVTMSWVSRSTTPNSSV